MAGSREIGSRHSKNRQAAAECACENERGTAVPEIRQPAAGRRLENSTGRPGGSVSGGGAGFPRPAAGSAEPSRSHGLAASWVGAGWGVGRPIASRFSTGRCCHLRSSSTGGRQARVRAVRGSSASGRQMDTAARVVSNLTKLQKVR